MDQGSAASATWGRTHWTSQCCSVIGLWVIPLLLFILHYRFLNLHDSDCRWIWYKRVYWQQYWGQKIFYFWASCGSCESKKISSSSFRELYILADSVTVRRPYSGPSPICDFVNAIKSEIITTRTIVLFNNTNGHAPRLKHTQHRPSTSFVASALSCHWMSSSEHVGHMSCISIPRLCKRATTNRNDRF